MTQTDKDMLGVMMDLTIEIHGSFPDNESLISAVNREFETDFTVHDINEELSIRKKHAEIDFSIDWHNLESK